MSVGEVWLAAHDGNYRAGGNSREYIVVHNTGNTASARAEANYAHNDRHSSSYHYVLDGSEIYQTVHEYDTAWAVGAWSGARQLIGNGQSISIEVCSDGTEFTEAERVQLRALTTDIMARYGIPAERVVRHWDCHTGRKSCPAYYCGSSAADARWAELKAYITTQTEEADMTDEQARMLSEIYGRLDKIDKLDTICRQLTRTDSAGWDTPDGHDIFGRVNMNYEKTPARVWNYRNKDLEEVDAYQILRDVRDDVAKLKEQVATLAGGEASLEEG